MRLVVDKWLLAVGCWFARYELLEAISKIIFGRFWYIVAVKSSDFAAIAPLCLLNLNFFRSTYPQNRLKAIFEIASSYFPVC